MKDAGERFVLVDVFEPLARDDGCNREEDAPFLQVLVKDDSRSKPGFMGLALLSLCGANAPQRLRKGEIVTLWVLLGEKKPLVPDAPQAVSWSFSLPEYCGPRGAVQLAVRWTHNPELAVLDEPRRAGARALLKGSD